MGGMKQYWKRFLHAWNSELLKDYTNILTLSYFFHSKYIFMEWNVYIYIKKCFRLLTIMKNYSNSKKKSNTWNNSNTKTTIKEKQISRENNIKFILTTQVTSLYNIYTPYCLTYLLKLMESLPDSLLRYTNKYEEKGVNEKKAEWVRYST